MDHFKNYPMPAIRAEAHFGDRVVRCFADRPQSFHAMFEAAAANRADREAMVFEGRRWTYRALDADVGRVAAGLAARGIGRGDRVALLLGNLPEFIFTLYAVQRLGAVAVPVSVREQKPGLEYILKQCGAKLVIHEAALGARVPDRAACPALLARIAVDDGLPLPDTGHPVASSDAASEDFTALLRHGSLDQASAVDPEDTALILYTSGTTGRPKGAMLTHLNIVHSVMHFETCMRLGSDERSALAVPASHVTGLIAIIATMLRVGGTLLVLRQFKAADYIAQAAAERVTQTILVPAMYNLILLQPEFEQIGRASCRERVCLAV